MRKMLVLLCLSLCLVGIAAVPLLAQGDLSHTVNLGSSDEFGSILVGPDGMSLYLFTRDSLDETVCYDRCAERWPPLTVASADDVSGDPALPGTLGTIERTDGGIQVTYNGMPLYYWFDDKAIGDTDGNGVGNTWYVIPPATVYIGQTADLGSVLVGPDGWTMYMFTNDSDGTSACYNQCAANWPALTVESADDLVLGLHLTGELGTSERTDGLLQVTYNGAPLYYYVEDGARGDTVGEGVGSKWYVIAPETVSVSSADALGDFLISPTGMTLYTFGGDSEGVSNCSGGCADTWPPFTVGANDHLAAPAGATGTVDTIERADGSRQVTYNGKPLYMYSNDEFPGDTMGQGIGGIWYVAAP